MTSGKQTRTVGQGALSSLSAALLLAASSTPGRTIAYRALAHVFKSVEKNSTAKQTILSCYFNRLRPSCGRHVLPINVLLSTHQLLSTYRTSTHTSTVTPHILYTAISRFTLPLASKHLRSYSIPWPLRAITTVLSPIFLPLFESLCYRSFNHLATVTWPTKTRPLTVLSPTKLTSKHLNSHRTRLGKDVLKICLKKTSGLMMIFIFSFFSPNRRRPTV